MRHLFVVGMLMFGAFNGLALADDSAAPAASAADTSAQCMPIDLDGQTTTACFGMNDEQVQSLGLQDVSYHHHCEMRCVEWSHHGRCLRWRRVCW